MGCPHSDHANSEENIKVKSVTGKGDKMVSQADLAAIMEPRILEILQLIKEEAGKMGFPEPLPAGVVLTGGVSLTKGLVELAEDVFNCSVRTAQPRYIGVQQPYIFNSRGDYPLCAAKAYDYPAAKQPHQGAVKGLWNRIRLWFQDFFA
jgi:cell division protein FtsA